MVFSVLTLIFRLPTKRCLTTNRFAFTQLTKWVCKSLKQRIYVNTQNDSFVQCVSPICLHRVLYSCLSTYPESDSCLSTYPESDSCLSTYPESDSCLSTYPESGLLARTTKENKLTHWEYTD